MKKLSDKEEQTFFTYIMEYCENLGDSYSELALKAIKYTGKGESHTSAIGASAYFFQQSDIYRYKIPEIVKNIYKEYMEGKNELYK